MNLPVALDVAIGLIVLYLILSTACSFAVELLGNWFWWRKRMLYETIARLLTGNSDCKAPWRPFSREWSPTFNTDTQGHAGKITETFWTHPLALSLAPDRRLPSYVAPSTFASIVMDMAVPGAKTGTLPANAEGLERVLQLAATSGEESLKPLREYLLTIFRLRDATRPAGYPAVPPLTELRWGIEKWYNDGMDRLTVGYKRKAQRWLLSLGFVAAVAFNADTIRAVYALSTNQELRNTVATYAATVTGATNSVVVANTVLGTNAIASAGIISVTNAVAGTNAGAAAIAAGTNTTAASPNSTAATPNIVTATNEVEVLRAGLVQQLKELQHLQQMGFPLGWQSDAKLNLAPYGDMKWYWIGLLKALGLAATALAVSVGAPFWYDLLNKLVSLRGSQAPAAEKKDEKNSAPESRPAPAAPGATPTAMTPETFAPLPSADVAKDLAEGRMGFDPRKAYWTAEASLLAYANTESLRATIEKQWALKLVYVFDKVESVQGFLAVSDASTGPKFAVLAFRGTEKKLEDWKADANFELTALPLIFKDCETHKGFCHDLNEAYEGIKAKIAEHVNDDMLLYVTGHSLGAALATLMAARLTVEKVRGVHAVYTFGSPRVGNPAFAKAYDYALGTRTYRCVNAEDLVTRVPPRAVPNKNWHYEHVGQIVYFDTDGRMQLNAAFWQRFLNTVINALADFRRELQSTLKDHSMEGYVRVLKKQINQP